MPSPVLSRPPRRCAHLSMETVDALLSNFATAQAHKAYTTRLSLVVRQNTKADNDLWRKELFQARRRHGAG